MGRRRKRNQSQLPTERRSSPFTYEKFGFSLMIGIGVLLLWVGIVSWLIPALQASFTLEEHRCLVLETKLAPSKKPAGIFRPEVKVRYTVHDNIFQTWTYDSSMTYQGGREVNEARLKPFVVGQECPCWYNEEDPTRVVVVRDFPYSILLLLLIPTAAIAAGIFGLRSQTRAVAVESPDA